MLYTRLCERLGIECPIVLAPMGPALSTPELAAAVSNAGGLGLVSFGGYPPFMLRQLIRHLRELTDRPFGVNFNLDHALLVPFDRDEAVRTCIEERVPVLSFSFGDPVPYVERAHAAGCTVIHQVGSVAAAESAVEAGVDVIIAQGVEAGGHLSGTSSTLTLVPRVVDAVAPTPVAAAGGIVNARGLVAAVALGAEGVVLGTRFLASLEAAAHPVYKEKVLAATGEDTVRTLLYGGGWPGVAHRVLRTPFVSEWLSQESRGQAQSPDEPVVGSAQLGGQPVSVTRFSALAPETTTAGELDMMCFLAGEGVGLVNAIKPAAAIIDELMRGAQELIGRRFVPALAVGPR